MCDKCKYYLELKHYCKWKYAIVGNIQECKDFKKIEEEVKDEIIEIDNKQLDTIKPNIHNNNRNFSIKKGSIKSHNRKS